jgi:hypothetical protein
LTSKPFRKLYIFVFIFIFLNEHISIFFLFIYTLYNKILTSIDNYRCKIFKIGCVEELNFLISPKKKEKKEKKKTRNRVDSKIFSLQNAIWESSCLATCLAWWYIQARHCWTLDLLTQQPHILLHNFRFSSYKFKTRLIKIKFLSSMEQ